MKKILGILFLSLVVFSVYWLTRDNKTYLVSLGDYLLKNDVYEESMFNYFDKNLEKEINYSQGDYLINDLIKDIENNKQVRYKDVNYSLHNLLIKADIIMISIGMNDLLYYDQVNNNMYIYMDKLVMDIDKLLNLVRYYSKEQIYIYNYYGFDSDFIKSINQRLEDVAVKYNVQIIDVSYIKNKKKLTLEDYKIINAQTIKTLKEN